MSGLPRGEDGTNLTLLCVTQGQWGEKISDNLHRLRPPTWEVHRWPAPRALPLVVDDPDDFLPATLPRVDLVLCLGETPAVAQLVPEIVRRTGARAVIAPIDRNETLPPGLKAQLQAWLSDLGVAAVFPKPFCSLTTSTYNWPPHEEPYQDAVVRRFAMHFGQPRFSIAVSENRRIQSVVVERESACGCARAVAEGLVGCAAEEAEHKAGMLHHHFPCLASMNQDPDYNDTLMHVSGHILRAAVRAELAPHLEPAPYLRPPGRVEPGA